MVEKCAFSIKIFFFGVFLQNVTIVKREKGYEK